MRLLRIEDGNFSLVERVGNNIPRYAILSHTWGADEEEVAFRDLVDGTGKTKAGYRKICFCGKQATNDGLQYFWVDTCCIDKSSSAELSEAINSMFRWYQDAEKCYVYLSDVSISISNGDSEFSRRWKPAFKKSRWFTRGWTLQELIAPASVEFFSQEETRLGDKQSLEQTVHEITGIATQALRGSSMSYFNVDERMSWAAKRETKREEDAAYCLLGVFNIHMPLIYGEGQKKALNRLQKEIKESLISLETVQSYAKLHHKQQASISDQLEVSNFQFELDQLDYDRCPDTGVWLLEDQAFVDFVKCAYSASFHLCGNPGSGKTFLLSKVIDELRGYFAATTSTVLIYFLCDGKTDASNRRTSLAALKSLTAQLLERIAAVDTAFVRTNVEALGMVKQKAKEIPEGQLFKILEKSLRYFEKCYLVVDAVDECDDWENLLRIFTRLLDANVCTLKFFLSSQKGMGIPYVISRLPVVKTYRVDVTAHAAESDIARYVDWRVRTLDLRSLGSPEEARDSLIHGCDGLFLLVRLRLDILTREILPLGTDIKAAISDLPSEVFPLYERLLDRLDQAHKFLAQILLIWVIHAQRVLTVRELVEAYRRELEDVRDFAAPTLSEAEIEALGGGLLEVHEDRVRLAHSTVKDFATLYNWGTVAKVSEMDQQTLNRRLFSKCLDYIASPTLVSQVISALQPPSDLQTSRPLADYAGRHWLDHLRLCSTNTAELSKKVVKFIQSDAGLAWWICYTNHIELHDWWTLPEISADINAWLHGNREVYRPDRNITHVVLTLCERHALALESRRYLVKFESYVPALLRLAGQKLDHGYTNEAETILKLAIRQSDRISSTHGLSMKYQAVLDLTGLLRYEGRYHEALQLCEGLQSDLQKVGDNSSRQLTAVSQSIGLIAGESGQLLKSELQFRNLLDTTMRKFGANDPDNLAVVHALALTCFHQSKHREAERLWDISHFKTVLGKNHPSTLTIMECLAELKRAQGKVGDSRQIRTDVLELRQARQGAESVDTIRTEIGLAYCTRDQGETAEAITNLHRLLDTTCKRFSDDHFLVLELKVALAELCKAAGDLTMAETFQLEVVKRRSQRLGGRHIWTLSEKTCLAAIYLEQRKYRMAADLLSEIRNARMEDYGTDYMGLYRVVELFARSKRFSGALQEAEELGCHALELAKKNGYEDNPNVLTAMANLAITKRQRGQLKEAPARGTGARAMAEDHGRGQP